MISIKNPMPGPWQAVGQITPESRVMVISNLALHADPLPNIIFSGEILKQTAYLTNDGVPIDYDAFRDVVELTISLSSTNNPNFNNFGAKSEIVAFFEKRGHKTCCGHGDVGRCPTAGWAVFLFRIVLRPAEQTS